MILNLEEFEEYFYEGRIFNEEIFNLTSVSFTEPVLWGDDYEVYDYTKEELLDAGLKVKGDTVYIPKGLNFTMERCPAHVAYFMCTFKGDVELEITMLEGISIDIDLTKNAKDVINSLKKFNITDIEALRILLDTVY